jgi:hypothetical protein
MWKRRADDVAGLLLFLGFTVIKWPLKALGFCWDLVCYMFDSAFIVVLLPMSVIGLLFLGNMVDSHNNQPVSPEVLAAERAGSTCMATNLREQLAANKNKPITKRQLNTVRETCQPIIDSERQAAALK